MTSDVAANQNLGWLLEDFVQRVPGADSALLASSDGLRLALARLNEDQADHAAAVMSGLHSLASGGVSGIKNTSRGVRQILIELDDMTLFVMSAGEGLPPGAQVRHGTDPSKVGTVLGVLASSAADPGLIGYEMAALIKSVSEHLTTPTRLSDAHSGDRQ